MIYNTIEPAQWLTDAGLSEQGRQARLEYSRFCDFLENSPLLSFQVARAKYFLQRQSYWTLPGGYALPPHTINVCVNNVCNLRCRYCDFGQGRDETFYHQYNVIEAGKKIEMSLEQMKGIVDQVLWFKPIIRASFREPLLHKDLLPFIDYAKGRGLPFWLLTNGLKLPQMAADLVRLGVDSVRLSLDGPPAIHDSIRGVKGAYERMISGAKTLLEERRARGSSMQVGFYFTLNDSNHDQILATVEQLDREGILREVFVNFQWLLYTTKGMAEEHNRLDGPICGGYVDESTVQNVDITKMDLRGIHEQHLAIKERYPARDGYRLHFRPSFEYEDLVRYRDTEDFNQESPRCQVPWYNLNINPAGQAKSFHHCLLPVTGNVFSDSILDVWNGEAFRGQRAQLQEHGAYRGCARCWGVFSLLEDSKRKD
jgi:MoaA/NifB/PqqE/SkfB family radical SAM enzyme